MDVSLSRVEFLAALNKEREGEEEEWNLDPTTKLFTIQDEGHTLGNFMRDLVWTHPDVVAGSYTIPNDEINELAVACQTDGLIDPEQAVVETLHLGSAMCSHVEKKMEEAMEKFRKRQSQQHQAT